MELRLSICRWLLRRRARARLLLTSAISGFLMATVLIQLNMPSTGMAPHLRQHLGNMPVSEVPRKRAVSEVCGSAKRNTPDLDLAAIFPTLNFSVSWTKKETFWNDAMERRYQEVSKKPPLPLKILVVPHSHNEHDRRHTVVDCYRLYARRVLDSIVQMMPQQPRMRFTWTEVNLLQLWWNNASETRRRTLRGLVDSGRLEITTGSWVTADEAVTRLYPLINQLTEGHQWLRHHLNVSARSGWSLGAAGHGSTLPHLLRQADIAQTVILETPPVWKEYLAAHQSGDFMWQQEWDTHGSSSMLTHHHPYFTYTTGDNCGLPGNSSSVCSSLDFVQNPPPSDLQFNATLRMASSNIKELAERLVKTAGRTASLFPHNVALLMLGGNGQFERESDWRAQYRGFSQLTAYLASRPELGAELQLATPSEYFREVRRRSGAASRLPTLSGDLHVYAARRGRPWSGYYTHLPHWRRAARQLEAQLHATELLYAWAWSQHREPRTTHVFHHAYNLLVVSRQDVGLFDHHHVATGAVAAQVLADYGERLAISQLDLTHAQLTAIAQLFLDLKYYGKATELFAEHAPLQRGLGDPPRLTEFTVLPGQRRRLLLFNPLVQRRTELVSLLVSWPGAAVTDDSGRRLHAQFSADRGAVRAQFLAQLEPLALHVFYVTHVTSPVAVSSVQADVELSDTFSISNARFELTVSKTAGVLSVLDRRDGGRRPFGLDVGALVASEHGRPITPLACERRGWTVFEGGVFSEVSVACGRVRLTVRLIHSDCAFGQAIHLQAETRPSHGSAPTDVALLLRTSLESCAPRGCGFYADANDYRMVWRPHVPAAGVAANVYPVTTQVSLEDSRRRVSLLMDHSRGVASFEQGVLTVMLDSQFDADGGDSGGDGERGGDLGGHEGRPVLASFVVTFDYLPESEPEPATERLFAPSALTAVLARRLSHPPVALLSSDPWPPHLHTPLRLLDGALPCGWELLTLRQLSERSQHKVPGQGAQLSLLRRRLDCRLWDVRDDLGCRSGEADVAGVDFVPPVIALRLQETTLTGGRLSPAAELRHLRDVRLRPDELRSFQVSFLPDKKPTTTSHRPDLSELAMVRDLNHLEAGEKLA